jgi:hypothetical protein
MQSPLVGLPSETTYQASKLSANDKYFISTLLHSIKTAEKRGGLVLVKAHLQNVLEILRGLETSLSEVNHGSASPCRNC